MLPLLIIVLLLTTTTTTTAEGAKFTITNNCAYTVWPGILSSAGTASLPTTGFILNQGDSKTLTFPSNWSGRLWGRTACTTDPSTNKLTCRTADCGSGSTECSGGGAAPPATLAEFTLDGSGGMDFYDVSLVDGYNLPMVVAAVGGNGNCSATGCAADLNGACPSDLRVDGGMACRSACEAFGSAEYCCSGEYGSPRSCKPSVYSLFFKNACPRAYSYAYDDATSTFTCANGADYVVTFCPSSAAATATSKKSSGENPEAVDGLNGRMVFLGGADLTSDASSALISIWPFALLLAFSSFIAWNGDL